MKWQDRLAELDRLDQEVARRIAQIEENYQSDPPRIRVELVEVEKHLMCWGKVKGLWQFHACQNGHVETVQHLPRHVRLAFYEWLKDPIKWNKVVSEAIEAAIQKRREVLA